MSKGQSNQARQPVSQAKGRETSQPRTGGSFIKPRNAQDNKPASPRTEGHGQRDRNAGDSKPFARRDGADQPRGNYGDKKPFVRRDGDAPREGGYGQRDRNAGDSKPFARREGSDQGRGRSEQARGNYGDKKPFVRRDGDAPREGGYGQRDRNAGDSKPFARREAVDQGRSSSAFADKKPFVRSEGPKVPRAKKLALRAPAQAIVEKSQRLRETRVDLDKIEPVRLQKALAASGAGSRREVEEMIAAGLILVNNKVAALGDRVGPQDRVVVKGNQVKLKWADRLPRIIMYHKQEGEIVTRDDPEGRVTVFDRLPQAKSSRWVAIGRLDVNTSGLLLVTTSGELANRMMHPSFEVEREYSVRVLGELTPEIMKAMTEDVELEDGTARFERVYQLGGREDGANHWVNVVIKEGRNREVRRMFEHFKLTVSRLIRIRFGSIGLPGRLKRGQFYELNEAEVAGVMKWSGLTSTGLQKHR
ncbi:pseudouridine synthase [Craterilacuibacter sp.]|uniref:pseudouridine synthase n=1 Tax=Craterilacuibacter sp. TaxID=2870909 RepID=UPI003F3F08B6